MASTSFEMVWIVARWTRFWIKICYEIIL